MLSKAVARLRRWLSPSPVFTATNEVREKVSSLVRAGRDYVRVARSTDPRHTGAVAALYRDALDCFLSARGLAAAGGNDANVGATGAPPPLDPAGFFSTLPLASTVPGKDALLLLREPQVLAGLGVRRATRALGVLDRVAASVVSALFPATETEARRLRLRRRIETVLLLGVALAFANRALLGPRNVARGKPVTASSVRMGSPQALVNGAIEWGIFGLHTNSGAEWATIDLERFYSLASAEIYARGDGRLDSNLPLQVELSDDGVKFRPAGSCKEIFTQATPCVVSLKRQRARYVRVAGYEVVLSEVEVYAAP
jgi:hypothetical protein